VSPNGFDPETFAPGRSTVPRTGTSTWWSIRAAGGRARGGVRALRRGDVAVLSRAPSALAVGRFTAVKRTGLLVRAFAPRAPPSSTATAALVLLGGFPGEWEDEHRTTRSPRAHGADTSSSAGWHAHDVLPDFLAASDLTVLASVREQFGSVLVEGMACGLPAIAVNRHGPAHIVDPGRTGWLVEPDDEDGLAGASWRRWPTATSASAAAPRRGPPPWRDGPGRRSASGCPGCWPRSPQSR
jgi:glycosyltransferase involved in cell wall biosynthesis